MCKSVSEIFGFKCAGGLWGREEKNVALYLYRKALVLASELIPVTKKTQEPGGFLSNGGAGLPAEPLSPPRPVRAGGGSDF